MVPPRTSLRKSANASTRQNGGRVYELSEFPLSITLFQLASDVQRESAASVPLVHHVFGTHGNFHDNFHGNFSWQLIMAIGHGICQGIFQRRSQGSFSRQFSWQISHGKSLMAILLANSLGHFLAALVARHGPSANEASVRVNDPTNTTCFSAPFP